MRPLRRPAPVNSTIDRTVLAVRDGGQPVPGDVALVNEAGSAAPAPVRQLVMGWKC